MVRGMCGGTTISSEGRWDLTNRWIGKKINRDLRTGWRQHDLDAPTKRKEKRNGDGGDACEAAVFVGGGGEWPWGVGGECRAPKAVPGCGSSGNKAAQQTSSAQSGHGRLAHYIWSRVGGRSHARGHFLYHARSITYESDPH
jgi:hypothetical protein